MYRITGIVIASMIVCISMASAQTATKWKVDKDHSSIGFTVKHFFTPIRGYFEDFDVQVRFDKNNLNGSMVTFKIKVASVNTQNIERDGHLLSEDFFDERDNGTIDFVSAKIEKKSDKNYLVYGKLTMRGIERDVVIPMEILGKERVGNKEIMGIRVKYDLNRGDWRIGAGSWAASTMVGHMVSTEIVMELNR